eukprot:4564305-Pyramimonas_sp.AAC.1
MSDCESPMLQQTMQVMSAIAYVKSNLMSRAQVWAIFPCMLERTTSENLWAALLKGSPINLAGNDIPSVDDVKWI